jgi:type II secretory pathway component GspD/PulD (secretin)
MRWKEVLIVLALSAMVFVAVPVEASHGSQHGAISIEMINAKVADVLTALAEMNRAQLDLDPGVTGRVSIGVGSVSWTTTLDLVCESLGCGWTLTGPQPRKLTVFPRPTARDFDPINLHLEDADPRKVLESFGRILDRETVIEGELQGGVSFLFESVSPLTALTATCESLGCLWDVTDDTLHIWVVPDAAKTGTESAMVDVLLAPINMKLKGAPAEAVLATFEKIFPCPVEIHPGIEGEITIDVERTPTQDVLTQLCAQVDCQWSISERNGEPILVFNPSP